MGIPDENVGRDNPAEGGVNKGTTPDYSGVRNSISVYTTGIEGSIILLT